MEQDILGKIILHKKKEIEEQIIHMPIETLEEQICLEKSHQSFSKSIISSKTGIIAEFKRKSPSKGWINKEAKADCITAGYEKCGAAAISVLTDEMFFGGSLKDLREARSSVNIPILRKDFIISEYQLYQAKAEKADAVLLIAAALNKEECIRLARKSHELNLEVLLEIHSEKELDYLSDYIDVVGVNNRNLGSFHTDTKTSINLVGQIPAGIAKISESGISDEQTLVELKQAGFNGFLIGETFMKSPNPISRLNTFIENLNRML